jgi:hypothetical protein
VSYHFAHWQNAAETASQCGHSEAVLFAHYREVVTPEAAAEFWSLTWSRRTGQGTGAAPEEEQDDDGGE